MNNNNYIIIGNSQIYRLINNDHWLLVTPCYKGIDKYISIEDANFLLKTNNAKVINYKNALCEINKQFRNFTDTWVHNNTTYMVKANSFDDEWMNIPKHKIKEDDYFSYKLCSFRGKLYWTYADTGGYYPRMQILAFNGIDKEPDWRRGQWTSVKNIKPIYYKDENDNWKIL